MSRVAICIPAFNGAAYLPVLLDSLQRQTFTDFRVFIADDVSSDNTVAVVKPFLADPRFQLVERSQNLGFNRNLIQLIEAGAGAEFFLMPGQDDVYAPAFLKNHINFFESHPAAALVHSRSELIDEAGKTIDRDQWYWSRLQPVTQGAELVESLLTHNFICLPAAMVRRAAFDEISGEFKSETYTFVPDWWLWLLLAARGWEFGFLAAPDCSYRLHSGQLTQTLGNITKTSEMTRVIARIAQLLDGEKFGRDLPAARRAEIRRLANARLFRRGVALALRAGQPAEGLRLINAAWRNAPLSVLGAPVFFGRYALAKCRQEVDCAGLIELFHPFGKRSS
jgi:hypothetical protein